MVAKLKARRLRRGSAAGMADTKANTPDETEVALGCS
jgi:hypothetical protein